MYSIGQEVEPVENKLQILNNKTFDHKDQRRDLYLEEIKVRWKKASMENCSTIPCIIITVQQPTVSTAPLGSITTTTVLTGGNVSSDGGVVVTNRGVVWSTSPTPTISLSTKTSDGSGTGSFTSSLSGLTPSTTYYVRAYATNSAGTGYGNEITFTTSTPVVLPTLSTVSASSITTTSATSGGNISSDGGASITARGVVWSTSPTPTISLSTKTSDGSGTGSFTSSLSGLTPSTTYYVRAYATNSAGTGYGNEITFTTTSEPP